MRDTGGINERFQQQVRALIPADVRLISGCEDYQTAAEVQRVTRFGKLPQPSTDRPGGVCTNALLEVLYGRRYQQFMNFGIGGGNNDKKKTNNTFQQILMDLRSKLRSQGYAQNPQLTSSRPLEIQETPFQIVGGPGVARALLVGINYSGQSGELSGCHNDVVYMKKYLTRIHGFQDENITILVDDGRHDHPTRQRVIQALKKLVTRSRSGDSVFFHYSGHGGLLQPQGNMLKTAKKDFDQTLIPVDHEKSGHIRDFSLFNHFIRPMAAGVTVTCVIDSCHSGSVLDLPYSYRATRAGEPPKMKEDMDALASLSFLHTLAGAALPPNFDNVADTILASVGGVLSDYQGIALTDQELQLDYFDTMAEEDYEARAPDFSSYPVVEYENTIRESREGVIVTAGGETDEGGVSDGGDGYGVSDAEEGYGTSDAERYARSFYTDDNDGQLDFGCDFLNWFHLLVDQMGDATNTDVLIGYGEDDDDQDTNHDNDDCDADGF